MFGYELGRVPRPARNQQTPEPASPYRLQACSQIWFDPLLLKLRALVPERRGSSICTGSNPSRKTATASAPRSRTSTSGERHTLRADYLVGCDGAASLVRRSLGIALTGTGHARPSASTCSSARPTCCEQSGRKPGTFFIAVDRGGVWGNLRIIDPAQRRLAADGRLRPATT